MNKCKNCGATYERGLKNCDNCGVGLKPRRNLLLQYFILIFFLVGAGVYYYLVVLCPYPIHYSIGNVDSRFHVSRDEVLKASNEAATLWNGATGQKMFVYDQDSKIKINLVYDDRQANLDKLNGEIAQLDQNNQSIGNLNDRLDQMVSSYQDDLAVYNKKLDAYNAEVEKWNNEGGAPASIFARLSNTQIESSLSTTFGGDWTNGST
ncbi:MAG: hypothetical protein WCO23_02785, partial [bacterium]